MHSFFILPLAVNCAQSGYTTLTSTGQWTWVPGQSPHAHMATKVPSLSVSDWLHTAEKTAYSHRNLSDDLQLQVEGLRESG